MQITQTFEPKSPVDWRKWLEKNHAKKSEIWLVLYKKKTGKQKVSYQEALDEALCYGWIDGIERRIDEEKYAIRFTPRRPKSNWSPTNIKRYKELLKAGRITAAGKAAFNKSR